MYGVFYATSFLDLYRSPRQVSSSSLSLTVTVDSDEQYLFLVSPLSITLASSQLSTNSFLLLQYSVQSRAWISWSTFFSPFFVMSWTIMTEYVCIMNTALLQCTKAQINPMFIQVRRLDRCLNPHMSWVTSDGQCLKFPQSLHLLKKVRSEVGIIRCSMWWMQAQTCHTCVWAAVVDEANSWLKLQD